MKKIILSVLSVMILSITATFAADKKAEPKEPPKEQRKQMANIHQKMADCLNSDKPMSECKSEMMKSCHDMMGKDGCPMMGQMGGKMGHGGMMGKEMKHDHQDDDGKSEK